MEETPMMKQYLGFKKQYPDKIVLFRMGDFFETFGDDAKTMSKILNITLTSRDKKKNATPLAGFPHKAIDQYLPKLVEAGYCVVIVDQLEDPKLAKGIVKRGITRIVTPGTLDGDEASAKKNSYIASLYIQKKNIGVCLADISTGEILWICGKYTEGFVKRIVSSFDPTEILLLEGEENIHISDLPVQFLKKGIRNIQYSKEVVKDFYDISSTESLGIEKEEGITALAMILKYIKETQLMEPDHIGRPKEINLNGVMNLDSSTIKNLELVSNAYTGDTKSSLLGILDNTQTRMGARLLYSWILNPLIVKKSIDERLNIVEEFTLQPSLLKNVREFLSNISDIERIVGKIGLNRANARDFKALELSLVSVLNIEEILKKEKIGKYIRIEKEKIKNIPSIIEKVLVEEPPLSITEGGIIKEGFSKEVDEVRNIKGDSRNWIKEFISKEKEKTGITTLKMGFNKVFGYYIEVTKSHLDKVPDTYIRKQTLVNCERYITEELKEKEDIILNAEEKLNTLEYEIFQSFRNDFLKYINDLQILSKEIAKLDVLSGFADIAGRYKYVKPEIYEMGEKEGVIDIKDGRHPIIERISDEEFISNDVHLDFKNSNMAILTGPNMSGKSTYIRQTAEIVLMAQMGSFVPAKKAKISIVDRVFTRVGASDDLAGGRSTFMVEMDEAANIVNNATKYSLVILDEIGRGTSTYDGVSIAWALAEYLVNDIRARTLFATHYHELLKLAEKLPDRVKNYNVLVEEDLDSGEVIFLRKIVEGGTDRSYGIYVAKMAGLPKEVIKRASEILESFEQESMFTKDTDIRDSFILHSRKDRFKPENLQIPMFTTNDSEVEKEIKELKINDLTPLEALNKISEWKKKVR
jgi:DNA mismatch repair protein MutS